MKFIAKADGLNVAVLTDTGEAIYRYQAKEVIVQLDLIKLIDSVTGLKDAIEKALADALAK